VETLWADLADGDEGAATRAALLLASHPKETVTWMMGHLQAVKVVPERIAKLIQQLDGDSFEEREKATEELEYFGKYIKKDLEKAAADSSKPEGRRRAQQLLERIPPEETASKPAGGGPLRGGSVSVSNIGGKATIMIDGKVVDLTPKAPAPTGPPRRWVRAVRAIAVLEHIGTPEAEELLRGMADGERDALPTKAARQTLQRLHK
jgi:hypothetical protein